MDKHKNPLEKEFLIRQHKSGNLKFKDFCERNKEMYKREILKLRIENERLKKTIQYRRTKLGSRSMFIWGVTPEGTCR